MSTSYSSGTNFSWPVKGETNWDGTVDTALGTISAHDHTGGGAGTQIATAAIATNAVTDTKIRLANAATLRSRNAANSGDVDLIKADANDHAALPSVTVFASTTQAITGAGAVSISSNLVTLSNAGATALTINIPTSSQAGQPVFITNIGAGTWTVTLTGQNASFDVATVLTKGSMILIPIGTTTWAVVAGGGCTLA